jgi:hypothetical protein
MVTEDAASGQAQQETVAKTGRIQSEIEFPYSDLETAVDLARALHSNAGSSCEDAELAAWLDQSINGGTYRARRSAARMFGLIEIAQGRLSLTPLGHRVVDSTEGRAARADAFLLPELYGRMYEQYRGQVLPPPPAIERHMEQLGVSPKQKGRARQVFQKSAQYAGYVDPGSGRFIRPGTGPEMDRPQERERRSGGGGGDGGDHAEIDPIIQGLLARLPKSGDVWPEPERKLWLELLAGSFKLIYKNAPSDSGVAESPTTKEP